jgi:hypothetical protein
VQGFDSLPKSPTRVRSAPGLRFSPSALQGCALISISTSVFGPRIGLQFRFPARAGQVLLGFCFSAPRFAFRVLLSAPSRVLGFRSGHVARSVFCFYRPGQLPPKRAGQFSPAAGFQLRFCSDLATVRQFCVPDFASILIGGSRFCSLVIG